MTEHPSRRKPRQSRGRMVPVGAEPSEEPVAVRVDEEDLDFEYDMAVYEGEPFTGEAVEYDRDGKMVALTTYRNGYEDGPVKQWFPDGTLRVEGATSYGVGAVGLWKEWGPKGNLISEREFNEKGFVVALREWDDAGNLVKDETYPGSVEEAGTWPSRRP